MSIHLQPTEHVIVSLTSIRAREQALRETVTSLVSQDISREYEVRVHLSHEAYLMDEGFPEPPKWIAELSDLNPLCALSTRFVRNTGPYRKLLPVLEECIDDGMKTVVVTCDDDTHYATSWLHELLRHHQIVGGLVAFRGHTARISPDGDNLLPYASWQMNPRKCHLSLANLPTGKDGVVYRPTYFDRAVLDVDVAMQLAPTADDLWFRWHSLVRGIPCYLIDLGDRVFEDVPSFEEQVSLWEVYNKKGGNDRTISVLEKHFQSYFGTTVSNTLATYQRGMRMQVVPNLDLGRKSPALLATRQVRMVSTLRDSKEELKVLTARSYELSRWGKSVPPTAQTPTTREPRSDRGGMLYAGDVVNRFDNTYGWMAHGKEAGSDLLVSVVMTTFNAEETIEWAARSVLNQDHRRLELIIVDDVSTDRTRHLLDRMGREDERVRVVLLPKNRGTYFAKNVGLLRAKGDIVTFQDADDWSHPARIRLQLWRLLSSGAVATRCNYVRHHARLNQLVKVNGRVESPGFITLMTQRKVFERDGFFDCSRRAADDEFICRLQALHGPEAVDSFSLPAYVALYSDQSLIADSSEYSATTGLRFQLGEDRERYKQAYTQWHDRLRKDASLVDAYRFPPHSIFIEKSPGLRAFEANEIAGLKAEVGLHEVAL
jgi:hypothetical protein